jgi:uncharacterized protein YjbI with pentapeptide repeats
MAESFLDEADFTGMTVSGCVFRRCSFAAAELGRTAWEGTVIEHISFEGAEGERASFHGATCAHVTFRESRWPNAAFVQTDVSDADFHGADMETTDLSRAGLRRVRGLVRTSGRMPR